MLIHQPFFPPQQTQQVAHWNNTRFDFAKSFVNKLPLQIVSHLWSVHRCVHKTNLCWRGWFLHAIIDQTGDVLQKCTA